jgi:hypothetical protein
MSFDQWEQWVSLLQTFVPHMSLPLGAPYVSVGDSETPLSGNIGSLSCEECMLTILAEDEDEDGTRVYHTRSWSVMARKGAHSESSSFVNQAYADEEPLISKEVLPNLPSFISQTSPINRPSTPPPESSIGLGK